MLSSDEGKQIEELTAGGALVKEPIFDVQKEYLPEELRRLIDNDSTRKDGFIATPPAGTSGEHGCSTVTGILLLVISAVFLVKTSQEGMPMDGVPALVMYFLAALGFFLILFRFNRSSSEIPVPEHSANAGLYFRPDGILSWNGASANWVPREMISCVRTELPRSGEGRTGIWLVMDGGYGRIRILDFRSNLRRSGGRIREWVETGILPGED